ncbi:MAG: MBOAT family protein, partial [Muribaculaceae bacterium]|nr:MBOAT family protein [Muribaculaceae bacterium]
MHQTIDRLFSILSYDPTNPLLFNTGLFLVLFAFFLIIYHSVKHRPKLKMAVVILFSLYFYYKSSAECVAILAGVCVSDWILGLWLGAARQKWLRRAIVTTNVAVNVGMLVYFKYTTLLTDALASVTSARFDPIAVMLPAGISFFTFRSISYMVDIYRGDLAPCRSLFQYSFFLTFFPPLLAGPVVRA